MPMLADTVTSARDERERLGERLRRRARPARRPGPRRARSSQSTTNSSPPMRAMVSWRRTVAGEPPAHRHQELVAGLVTEAVVHQLEAVEVDEQHRDCIVVVGLGEPFERVLEPVLRQRAVGEAGQGVVQREATELLGARVAVDGERGEVAGALEDRQLARARVAHGAEEEAEQRRGTRCRRASGWAPTTCPRSPCARQSSLSSARAPSCSMSREHAGLGRAQERLDVARRSCAR